MATISRFSAVALIGKLRFTGFVAWLMWLAVHLVYLTGFKNRVTALVHWSVSFLGRGRSERVATEQQIFARAALSGSSTAPPTWSAVPATRASGDDAPPRRARGAGRRGGATHRRRRAGQAEGVVGRVRRVTGQPRNEGWSAMSSTATPATGEARAAPSPAGAFTSILNAAVGSAAASLEHKAGGWADKLEGIAGGGAKEKAGAEGVKAVVLGKNPVWAVIRGTWQAGTPAVRAAIIASVVSVILLLLLFPVLLVVFLLGLLIVAAVHRARATRT